MTSISAGLASASAGAVSASSRRMLPIVPRRVGLAHSFSGQKYLKVFRGGGAALSAAISLDLVPFLYLLLSLLLDLLFRRNHPGGWLEAFL